MPHAEQTGQARTAHPDDALIEALAGIVFEAGREALGLRPSRGGRKKDEGEALAPLPGSPEERAKRVILDALSEIAPRIPIAAPDVIPHTPLGGSEEFFLVAPLDGAVEGSDPDAPPRGDFTLGVGLIRAGEPAIGVVFAPTLGRLWAGRPGLAWKAEARPDAGVGPNRPIRVRLSPVGGVTAVTSLRGRTAKLNSFLAAYPVTDVRTAASAARFCLIAEGIADIHPDLGRSMAWSTAAGDAILRAAGGRTLTLDGEPLRYGLTAPFGGEPFSNPEIVALGSIGLKTPVAV